MSTRTGIIILAAGQGTRMRSNLPKVLHPLAGRPLLAHVIDTARACDPADIIVVHGHGGERVREAIGDDGITWTEQREQLGTGHAVQQALEHLPRFDRILVLYGDVPLLRAETCQRLLDVAAQGELAILTMILDDPHGYGRILRGDDQAVRAIREQRDASPEERAITEVNTGIMAVPAARLGDWLQRLDNDNAQQEYYLTDIVEQAVADGVTVRAVVLDDPVEAMGVNDRVQLASLERSCQARIAESLMRDGVSLADPARIDVRGRLDCAADVSIDVGCVFEGEVGVGTGSRIGPHCVIRNSRIGEHVEILSHCVIDGAVIGDGSRVGPYARLRPEAELASRTHVGNFVEIKKSRIGEGSKINHLSYVGDSIVGRDVNIGAGTITCNYDGANKHQTIIGDEVFIGSDTQLVAPVTIGDGATIGAGSTITSDTPAGKLTLSRSKQRTIDNWQRPVKKS